jgi:heptosyltransferase II
MVKYILIKIIKTFLFVQKITHIGRRYKHSTMQNILIYVSMGIGDLILFTPTIKAVRKAYPLARIVLWVNNQKKLKEVIKGSELVDEIIFFSRRHSFFKKMRFIKGILKKRFDLLINGFWTDDIYLVLISIAGNIPLKAGYCESNEWKSKYDFLYNIKIKFGNEHEIDRGLRFAYALGINKSDIEKKPILCVGKNGELFAQRFLKENNLTGSDLIIGIHPGAAFHQKWKRWGIENYAELSERLTEHYKAKIIIFGTKEEIKLAEYIKERLKHNAIIAVGKTTTIKEAAALIRRCNVFVCNDSGLMHVSAAVNTSVIAIYGPTDPHRTAPFGDGHIIIKKDLPCSPCFKPGISEKAENCPNGYECLTTITANEVFNVIGKKIEQLTR